jgi:hypothetical protein
MRLVDLIGEGKYAEATELIKLQLENVAKKKLQEAKCIIAADIYEEVEDIAEANIQRMGRIQKIRRRIRRNAKGRIVVQRNVKRSAIKGFRISGNTVKRIPAMQRINKARKLKRYWKTKGKAKLNRTLLKRKMSIRRRTSMGIK